MIDRVLKISRLVKPRTRYDVLAYLMEEVGELSSEVMIQEGYSLKPAGKDGIIGEAADVIICTLDLIYLNNPNVSAVEIENVIVKKLAKWFTNCKIT